ncbi:MAG: recombinase family protein [Chloroflexota bacterium]
MSLREIVSALNENGFTTRRGKEFQAMTVKRILDRAEL